MKSVTTNQFSKGYLYFIMKRYTTENEAIKDLKRRGFTLDFNKAFTGPQFSKRKVQQFLVPDKFKLIELHRFVGESALDHEVVIFAIESTEGYKGILRNGYGVSTDSSVGEFINKLVISP